MPVRIIDRDVTDLRGIAYDPGCPDDILVADQLIDGGRFSLGAVGRVRLTPAERVGGADDQRLTEADPLVFSDHFHDVKLDVGQLRAREGGSLIGLAVEAGASPGYTDITAAFAAAEGQRALPAAPGWYGFRAAGEAPIYAAFELRPGEGGWRVRWTAYRVEGQPDDPGRLFGRMMDLMRIAETGDVLIAGVTDNGEPGLVRLPAIEAGCGAALGFRAEPTHIDRMVAPVQIARVADVILVLDAGAGMVWAREVPLEAGRQQLWPIATGFVQGTGLAATEVDGAVTLVVADQQGLHVLTMALDALQDRQRDPIPAGVADVPLGEPTGHLAFFAPDDPERLVVPHPLRGEVALYDLGRADAPPLVLAGDLEAPRAAIVLPGAELFVGCARVMVIVPLALPAGDLVVGLGHVPFEAIETEGLNIGRADTEDRFPDYFFQVKDALFGGRLHLMIDHGLAWESGHRGVRVSLDGPAGRRVVDDGFGDLRWNPRMAGFETVWVEAGRPLPEGGAVIAGAYPIRAPDERWFNPRRAAIINTGTRDEGLNTLEVAFFDADGREAEVRRYPLAIDNARCQARLQLPEIGGIGPAPRCGCLPYGDKDDGLAFDFEASHPRGEASYRVAFARGGRWLPDLPVRGEATAGPQPLSRDGTDDGRPLTVRDLMAECNVAHVKVRLSVSTGGRVIDGYRRLGRAATHERSFTLVPDDLQLDEP